MGLPGSDNHWSDDVRSEYGNYMVMSSNTFDTRYGDGASAIAGQLMSDPAVFNAWQQQLISTNSVRQVGYMGPTAGLTGEPGKSIIDNHYGTWVYSKESVWVQTVNKFDVGGVTTRQRGDDHLNNLSIAFTALGTAISGVDLSIPANIQIALYDINGVKTVLNSTQVQTFLAVASKYTLYGGFVVDVASSFAGYQSWNKTILNTAIAGVAISIGGVPAIVIGLGYLILDKGGAFDLNLNAPSYKTPLNPPDALNYINPYFNPE